MREPKEVVYEIWRSVKEDKIKILSVVGIVGVIALYQLSQYSSYDASPAQQAAIAAKESAEESAKVNAIALMRGLKASLKDPDSAKFGTITIDAKGALLCGEVNAKNSFGGYTGVNNFAYSNGAGYMSGDDAYQLCYGDKPPFPQTIDLTGWF